VALFDGRDAADYLLTGTINHLEEVDDSTGVSVECSISARLIGYEKSPSSFKPIDRYFALKKQD
jgi:hypothetical protein